METKNYVKIGNISNYLREDPHLLMGIRYVVDQIDNFGDVIWWAHKEDAKTLVDRISKSVVRQMGGR